MSHRFRQAAPAVTLCDVTHLCVYARTSLARRLGIKESELAFEHAKGQGYAASLSVQDKNLRFRGPIRGLGYGPDVAIAELAAAQNALFQMDCAEASLPKDRRDAGAPIDIPASAGLMVVVGDKQMSRGKAPLDRSWASGVLRSEWHARKNRCQATLDSVASGQLPVDCGVPFIDATSAIVNDHLASFTGRRDLWMQGFDAFVRSIPRSVQKQQAKGLLQPLSVPFSVGGPNTTLTVLPIPERHLHAYGVGKGRRQSLGIALYHRNVILKKLEAEASAAELAADASEEGVGGAEIDLGADSGLKPQSAQAKAPALPATEPVDPSTVERLLSLFASANSMDTPQWRAVEVTAVPGSSRFHHVGYELAVGPTSTHGSGNTPGQAQHAALESMHATLLSMDPKYAEFVKEVRGAVKIDDLNSSVELRLPQRLRDRIVDVASPIAARAREEEADDDRSVLDENETGLTDGTGVFMRSVTGRRDTEQLSLELRDRRRAARSSPSLERIQEVRAGLPIAAARDEIVQALADTRVVVLCGTTGSGKTTQVPQFLLDAALEQLRGADFSVVVTQPRRISAVSVAERIATERGEKLGDSCGYAVRLDSVRGRNINIVTVGVLLQGLRRDPQLEGVDVLILDEVHDRSTDIDLALAFAKNALAANPNLKLIVMSATLQSELYAGYFGGAARVINVDGRLHPVKEYHLDDLARLPGAPASCRQHTGGGNDRRFSHHQHYRRNAAPSVDHGLVMWTVERAIQSHEVPSGKSILVFVPGWKDLAALQRLASQSRVARFHTIILHSSVDKKDQMLAFRPPPEGTVKLVLATNIAETGITIDDVGAVIDTGLVRMKTTDISRGADSGDDTSSGAPDSYMASVDHLTVTHISKASAMQRKGRAGRTAGGTCYRLYSASQAEALSEFQEPEILRTALEGVLLRLAAMKLPVSAFLSSLIDPPALHKVAHAAQRLHVLGAAELPEDFDPADTDCCHVGRLKLTHLGRWLSRIPVDPGLGKLVVLGAMLECLDPALTVAACAEHTPFITAREAAKRVDESRGVLSCLCGSDQLVNVLAFNELAFAEPRDRRRVAATNMLSELSVFNISRIKEQLRTILAEGGFIDHPDAYEAQRPAATLHHYNDGAPLCVDEGPASDHECINTLSLLRVLIAASLYPNVGIALRRTGGGGGKRRGKKNRQELDEAASRDPASEPLNIMRLRTQHDERLRLAGSSVVRVDTTKPGSCRDPLVAFDKPMRIDGRSPRVSRATQVSMWGLLVLAAAPHHVTYNAAVGVGRVGRWLTFRCRRESFEGVTDLRDAMTHCMARVAADPRDVDAREQLRALRSILCDLLEDSSSVEVHGSDDEGDSDQDDVAGADPEHGRRQGHGDGHHHHQHKHRGSHHHQHQQHHGGHARHAAAPPREDPSGFGEPVFDD